MGAAKKKTTVAIKSEVSSKGSGALRVIKSGKSLNSSELLLEVATKQEPQANYRARTRTRCYCSR